MNAVKRFEIRLEDSELEMLEGLRRQIGLSSKKQTITYLMNYYVDSEKRSEELVEAMKKVYPPEVKLSIRACERYLAMIMDVLNTLMISYKLPAVLIPTDVTVSKLFAQASEEYKRRLAHFKQNSDDKKKRGQKKS